MAQKNLKYNFRSVGKSKEESQARFRTFAPLPISIATPIRFDNTGKSLFAMHTNQIQSIKDNLRNLIACDHGSRLLMGDFGANLSDVIGSLGTEDGDEIIMQRISNAVSTYMPFISLAGFDPIRKIDVDGNVARLAMVLTFTVPALGAEVISIEINMYEAK